MVRICSRIFTISQNLPYRNGRGTTLNALVPKCAREKRPRPDAKRLSFNKKISKTEPWIILKHWTLHGLINNYPTGARKTVFLAPVGYLLIHPSSCLQIMFCDLLVFYSNQTETDGENHYIVLAQASFLDFPCKTQYFDHTLQKN